MKALYVLFNEYYLLKLAFTSLNYVFETAKDSRHLMVFMLSGTKIDLREDKETLQALSDSGQSPIKREQGQKLANKIRAVKYLECSALTQRGLKQVIKEKPKA